jgi:hypothetical protein
MKFLYVILLIVIASSPAYSQCGSDRWAIKTLTDPAASSIDWTEHTTTVSAQGRLGRPFTAGWLNQPRHSTEKKTYAITGKLIKYGEEGDNDYHLVLRDLNTSETIIAEIPDPANCTEVGATTKASQYAAARAQIDALFGAPPRNAFRSIPRAQQRAITIHGVGFFDKRNHGTGHAKNGREIHPVYEVE